VAPGTMLLEALYTVNCVAPRALQVERFLPLSPMRLLVDARGKDLATLVPHHRLNELIQSVRKSTALAIIKQVHQEVEAKMGLATATAEQNLAKIVAQAEQSMRRELGEELDRLQALRKVNPSIREEEVSFLRHRIDECAVHIRHANLQLQALRLVITT
jgi:ATP-dependent helicase HepA